jgi:hypothetical protein
LCGMAWHVRQRDASPTGHPSPHLAAHMELDGQGRSSVRATPCDATALSVFRVAYALLQR